MITYQNQCWDCNGLETVRVFDRFQIAIDHELAMRAPHFAIEVPGRFALIDRIVIGIWMILVNVREVSLAPGGDHVLIGVAVFFISFAVSEQALGFHFVDALAQFR